jgi:hypothetical protein
VEEKRDLGEALRNFQVLVSVLAFDGGGDHFLLY